MSKTDKDVPYRLKQIRDGYVSHNHTGDECRVETDAQALMPTRRNHSHFRTCKKYVTVITPCLGALLVDARQPRDRWGRIPHTGRDTCRFALEGLAAFFKIYCDDPDDKHISRLMTRYTYGKRYFCSREHTTRVYHPELPCTCDDDPQPATCHYTLPSHNGGGYCVGGVPSEFVSLVYHRPQRRVTRDVLRDARRDYNANGATDVEPENTQARNSARWMWW